LISLAITASIAFTTIRAAIDSGRWVEHTLAVEKELAELSSALVAAEESYLESVLKAQAEPARREEVARAKVTTRLQRIEALTRDNANQQRRISDLRRAVDANVVFGAQVVAASRDGRWETARLLLTSDAAAVARSRVRSLVSEMISEEERLLGERTRRASIEAQRATALEVAVGLFMLLAMVIGYVLIRKDSHSHRVLLGKLLRSEESLATTLNSIGDAVIATDAAGRVVRMNPVAEQLTGWQADAAEGKDLAEVFHILNEETLRPVESPAGTVLRQGKVVGLGNHTVLISRDGTERVIVDSGAPIRSAEGKTLGVVLVFRDQTEARKAQRQLQQSEARFRRLKESGIIGIVVSDSDGNITEANDAFLTMLGYSPEDLMAGRLSGKNLNTPERDQTDARARVQLQNEGIARPWEKELVRKDGSRVPVLIAVAMLEKTSFVAVVADLTQNKRAEAALQKSQARLAALYDAGVIGILVGTLDGRILEINDALLGAVGYSRQEILSGSVVWKSLTPPEWRDSDTSAVEQLKDTGVIALRQKEYLHKDGSRVPVMSGAALLAGTVDETISFVLDLTANKQAALAVEHLREVRASETMFRGLLEAAPDAVVIVDSAGKIVRVNHQAERLFGYTPKELVGQSIDILTPERLREARRAQRGEHMANTAPRVLASNFEIRAVRKDGTEFPVEVSQGLLETADGPLISSAIRDISERKRSEMQRFHLAAIVDSSSDAIVGKTLDGIVTSWNDGAHRMFGYTSAEMVGKSITLLIPTGREHEEVAILEQLRRDARVEQFDTVRRRKDGSELHVSLTSSPIHDGAGGLIGASKIVRDITARRHAEQALAAAKDAAEAANRELEAFSYSVAHDLRAPLRGMNGFARSLLNSYRDKLDAEGQDWLQEIVLNAKKMGELIDGLLSLARVTRSDLQRDDVDLSEMVRDTVAQLAFSEPERSVELGVQDQLHANVDVRLARALLQNLLGNAWKFTSKMPVARLEFGSTDKAGLPAFFVRDNGAGFDMAFANKLFAPFQRLHTVDEFVGTGIGLATVQRIVHRHGGRVWAESAVDAGATFYFTFSAETSRAAQ
jgi:PAS domain S-box-containing protein